MVANNLMLAMALLVQAGPLPDRTPLQPQMLAPARAVVPMVERVPMPMLQPTLSPLLRQPAMPLRAQFDTPLNLTPREPPKPKRPLFPPLPALTKAESQPDATTLQVQRHPIPAEAVAMALEDAGRQPVSVQPLLRYIWVPSGEDKDCRAVSYVVNATMSNMSVPHYWPAIGNGQMVRINLGLLASDSDPSITFQTMAAVWETVPNPYFRIETSKEIVVAEVVQRIQVKINGAKIQAEQTVLATAPLDQIFVVQGQQGDWIAVQLADGRNGWIQSGDVNFINANQGNQLAGVAQKVLNFAEHTELENADLLQRLTQSNNPVVRYDLWMANALSTVDGGNYYKWINIPRASVEQKRQGVSDLQALLLHLGVRQSDIVRLGSDQRAAMFRSNVTGKPRQIEFFKGLQGRATINEGRIFLTGDMRDRDINPKLHAMRNLLEFKPAGREAIWEWKNGSHRYALYDNNGNLVDSVPDDIAKDHDIPPPYTGRLQAGISCLRCHGKAEQKGIQPVANDVLALLSAYKKQYPALDVFDDAADKTGVVPAVLNRLAGLYSGDLTKPLMRSQNDCDDATFLMTGGQSGGLTHSEMVAEVVRTYNDYYYAQVSSQLACQEMGYLTEDADQAVALLNRLLPPLPDTLGQGFSEEDPILGALKAGLAVNRFEWEQAYVDAMNRAMLTIKAGGQKAQPQPQQ